MFNENYQWCENMTERLYAIERRRSRLKAPDLAERREAEPEKYAAYKRACWGLYAHDAKMQDAEGVVLTPTWEPDKSETWAWFWQLMDSQRDCLLRGMIAESYLPEFPTVSDYPIPDGFAGEIVMKRVRVRLERFNFQKIDDLMPEKGNIVRLVDSLATANLTEYLEKRARPENNA